MYKADFFACSERSLHFQQRNNNLSDYDSIGAASGTAAAVSSVYFPLSLPVASARPLALRSTISLRSLSIFSLTMATFDGWMPT